MIAAARREEIKALLMESGAVSVSQLQARFGVAADAKLRLADAAFGLLEAGETLFLDSSSTAFFLARHRVLTDVDHPRPRSSAR